MRLGSILIVLLSSFQVFAYDYPSTPKKPTPYVQQGIEIKDNYRWLEDSDSSEVRSWVTNQNNFAQLFLNKSPNKTILNKQFKKLMEMDFDSPPFKIKDKTFFSKRKAGKRTIVYMKINDQPEKIVFDANLLSPNDAIGSFKFPKDGSLIVYTICYNNADRATAFVRSTITGEDSKIDRLEGLERSSFDLSLNDDGIYYVHIPKISHGNDISYLKATVKFHKFGTSQNQDITVFSSEGKYKYLGLERHGKWLFLNTYLTDGTVEYFIKNLDGSVGTPPKRISLPSAYKIEANENWIYVRTNLRHDNFSLVRIAADRIESNQWETVIAGELSSTLEDFTLWGGRLFLKYINAGVNRVFSTSLDGYQMTEITLPDGLMPDLPYAEVEDTEGFMAGDSMISPTKIYKISAQDLKPVLYKEIPYSGAVKASNYVQENFEVQSEGVQVTVHLARKTTSIQKQIPILLSVYGGFCQNQLPIFDPSIIPWLDAGGGYAIVQARGGCEKGSSWHVDAMGRKKKNTFVDVISAAENLILKGYTKKGMLGLIGSSNGGLTVNAVMTIRPDLFGAVVSEVSLSDMLKYTEVGTTGDYWISEYGDPLKNIDDFRNLLSYSPYHNIKPTIQYPSVLVKSSQYDDRVHPMHSRKIVAALQATDSKNIVLLSTQSDAGHRGSASIQKKIDELTDTYTFLMEVLNLRAQM